MTIMRLWIPILATLGLLLPPLVNAETLHTETSAAYLYDFVFPDEVDADGNVTSEKPYPVGGPPWLTAKFEESTTSGNVTLTLEAPGLTETDGVEEFVSKWYFNFDPSLNPDNLTFSLAGSSSDLDMPSDSEIQKGVDSFKADGDGHYDILIPFSTDGSGRFVQGSWAKFDVSYSSAAINVRSFDFLSVRSTSHGPYLAAAHIQAIGGNIDESTWIAPSGQPVPEPATLFLVGIGLFTLPYLLRKRCRKE